MKRLMSLLAVCWITTNVGCALCSSCDDYSYGSFGGLWERSDLTYGRVGSVFSPAGFPFAEGAAAREESEATQPEVVEPPAEDQPPRPAEDERSLLETSWDAAPVP